MDWSIVEEAISRAHAVSVDSCHNITIWAGSRRPNPSGDGVLTKPRATEAQMLAAVKEWWGDACYERQITEDNRLEFWPGIFNDQKEGLNE